MASRHGEKKLKCLKCDAGFPTVRKLKEHLYLHSNLTPFSCSSCGFSQKLSKRIHTHIKSHKHTNASCLTNEADLKEMQEEANREAEIIVMRSKSNIDS